MAFTILQPTPVAATSASSGKYDSAVQQLAQLKLPSGPGGQREGRSIGIKCDTPDEAKAVSSGVRGSLARGYPLEQREADDVYVRISLAKDSDTVYLSKLPGYRSPAVRGPRKAPEAVEQAEG